MPSNTTSPNLPFRNAWLKSLKLLPFLKNLYRVVPSRQAQALPGDVDIRGVPTTRLVGATGEKLAQTYLEERGYRFITANWSCKLGEIDLIMQDGATRVMVEVRLRRPTSYGSGDETVAWQKQQKLIRTAKYYQQQERYWGDLRFDVVSITAAPDQSPQITHIPNAFDVS